LRSAPAEDMAVIRLMTGFKKVNDVVRPGMK
jgi:hypothetical protein